MPAAPDHRTSRHPLTPDGRYFVVRGRLWRCSDPSLPGDRRVALVRDLRRARSAVGHAMRANDKAAVKIARAQVDAAKVALGERGPVWWSDGAPDFNRRLVQATPYADWFAALDLARPGPAPEPKRVVFHALFNAPSPVIAITGNGLAGRMPATSFESIRWT